MRNYLLTLLFWLFTSSIVGCGSLAESIKEANATPSPTPTPTATPTAEASATPEPTVQALETPRPSPSGDPQQTDVSVAVQVDVNVKQTTGAAAPAPISGAVFSPAVYSWHDAVIKAPEGKRLATRAEVIELYDAGKLEQIHNSPMPDVWTATEVDGIDAWEVGIMDGSAQQNEKSNALPAIYVDSAKP